MISTVLLKLLNKQIWWQRSELTEQVTVPFCHTVHDRWNKGSSVGLCGALSNNHRLSLSKSRTLWRVQEVLSRTERSLDNIIPPPQPVEGPAAAQTRARPHDEFVQSVSVHQLHIGVQHRRLQWLHTVITNRDTVRNNCNRIIIHCEKQQIQ